MAYWAIVSEVDVESPNTLISLFNDEGYQFNVVFKISDKKSIPSLGVIELTADEITVFAFLTKNYSLDTAAYVLTAFKFGNSEAITNAKFSLAPHPNELDFSLIDVWGAKKLLKLAGISGRKFSKIARTSERTMRNRLNPNNDKSSLSLAEKYLLNVLSSKKDENIN